MMKDNAESGDGGEGGGEEMGNIYISSEQIIKEVQKYRCLYDPAVPEHKDRDVVRDAWLSVSQAVVGEPWESMNSAEKDEAADNVEKKWRIVRDMIRNSLKNPCRRTRNKPGIFYEEQPPHSEAENSRSLSEADDTSSDQVADGRTETSRSGRNLRPKRNAVDYLDDSSAAFDDDDLMITYDSPAATTGSKRKKSMPQRFIPGIQCTPELSSYPGINYHPPAPVPEPENPDRMFLLSLLPRVHALNSRNKLDFQIKAMQMLQRFEKE